MKLLRFPVPTLIPTASLLGLVPAVSIGQALQPAFVQTQLADLGEESYRTRAWGLAVADFNEDTFADFLSGDTAGDVHLYLGDGSGAFTSQGVVINQSYHDAYALVAGDFNEDDHADFVVARTGGDQSGLPAYAAEGELHLYLGNGDGTFQSTGFPQLGTLIGNAGTDCFSLAAADVDGDGDLDLVSGERISGAGDTADIRLWRNRMIPDATLAFDLETIDSSDGTLDPEDPPYFPPSAYLHVHGLALGDVTGDAIPDLLVSDKAHYLYVYANDGNGVFSPIRFDTPGLSTRPYAYRQLDALFNEGMPLAVADVNDDGMTDILTGYAGPDEGSVSLWVNEGLDGDNQPVFTGAGAIGAAGIDVRGLAAGQLDSSVDAVVDVVFGNLEGEVHALFPDLTDSDGDGLIDLVDNAPDIPNAPRIDLNTDGSINVLDQLDNDGDGVGDPADGDDDNDGVPDGADNAPFIANGDQADSDGDGAGDVADPFNNTDSDGDGVADGPLDPELYALAIASKGRWSRSDTHFIIRIDALARAFQNEFVQTFTDAAILTPGEWELHKNDSYNGIGDDPADPGYSVPIDLPGGMDCPVTLATIPRLIWNAFGDPDPIDWINARIDNPNLEISQHGTYHTNNTLLGDWAELEDRNVYSSEFAGLTLEENFQLLRVGQRSLLGDYAADSWILDSGVEPATAPKIDWSIAAWPLISYAPPFNTADTTSRDATARLGFVAYSASIAEEEGFLAPFFSPEGSHHEAIDQFGMFHPSADLEVDPEPPAGQTYLEFLESITQIGQLNTWLIEEVSWSTRYCNDVDRLEPCAAAPGGINRENNMVDEARWANWLTLLGHAQATGEVMTMGGYSLAMQTDNAPTVPNPDQADSDHDGIGDVIDGATLAALEIQLVAPAVGAEAVLTAVLLNGSSAGIPGQTITFFIDIDGDESEESFTAVTGADGTATTSVLLSGMAGESFSYRATWDGGPLNLEGSESVRIVAPGSLRVTDVDHTPGGPLVLTVEGFDPAMSYSLLRTTDLAVPGAPVVTGFVPSAATDTISDPSPPDGRAFYQVAEE